MIFTAGPLARSQTTSDPFKAVGALNLAPAKIGEVNVTGVRARTSTTLYFLLTYIWAFVASALTNLRISVNKSCVGIASTLASYPLVRPPLIVTYKKETKEIVEKLTELGFSALSQGQYKYWKGTGSEEAIEQLLRLGVEPDAYAPRNTTSIYGISTFVLFSRIVHATWAIINNPPTSLSDDGETAEETDKEGEEVPAKPLTHADYTDRLEYAAYRITEETLNASLPEHGTFFPYFDGLLLADDAITVQTVTRLFSSMLGATPASIAENLSTLASGWKSLASTPAGRAFSHIFFCIALSLDYGYPCRPVYLYGVYSGTVFCGQTCWFMKGLTLVKTSTRAVLKEEIMALVGHDAALERICSLLSGLNLVGTKDTAEVLKSTITSARLLHYAVQKRTLTPENHAVIRNDLKKLQFNQTYWEITDAKRVMALVHAITRKELLADNAPCYLFSDGFFSSDTTYSALLAFGSSAPSLSGLGTNVTRPISKDMYKGITSPAPLQGMPLFAKDLQRSYEDWKSLLAADGMGVVKFGHAGKDKLQRLKVKNVAGYILWETDEYKQVLASLTNFKAARGAKKRQITEEEPVDKKKEEENEERKKKRRMKGFGMLGLLAPPAAGTAYDGASAEDDFDMDNAFA